MVVVAGPDRVRSRRPATWIAAILAAPAVAYAAWAGVLHVTANGVLAPPPWRVPDLPPGAEVLREGVDCAPQGCLRTVVVAPPSGQDPVGLAHELVGPSPTVLGWRWDDPHPVRVHTGIRGERLLMVLSY